MDIRHLRYFLAVADALSFVGAARVLNMSQPPLSKTIADLENEIGTRLFYRSSKVVELTKAGEAFLPHARDAVQAFNAARHAARSLSSRQSRILRIALPPETSRSLLSIVLDELQREQAKIQIVEASTSQQICLLAAGDVEIGIVRHPFDAQGLHVSEPLSQPLGVVVAAGHPLASAARLRVHDLEPYPLVQFPREMAPGFYDELLQLCRLGGYVPPRILHSTRMMKAFLRVESAVTFASERLASRRDGAGPREFVWKPLEGSPIHWWTSVVCRADGFHGLTRLAAQVLFSSLQRDENWIPMPRLAPSA